MGTAAKYQLIGVGLLALMFVIAGPARVWRVVGEPDLGTVAFETLQRRSTPNDALACPPGVCAAHADIITQLYPMPAQSLRTAFAEVIANEPRITRVAADNATLTDRYIQRSALLEFPDTIAVRFFERPAGQSTLALYSRSQLGSSDFGVNRARIERWLGKLSANLPALQ